jgi:hypothetical protein
MDMSRCICDQPGWLELGLAVMSSHAGAERCGGHAFGCDKNDYLPEAALTTL